MHKISSWFVGLIDNLTAVELIISSKIGHKNRIALIILDSTLEIAFKDYLYNIKKLKIDKKLLEKRKELHRIVKNSTSFDKDIWDNIDFFYKSRCDLYHEDSNKTLTDESINEFYEITKLVIDSLFKIDSNNLIKPIDKIFISKKVYNISINSIPKNIDKLLYVVKESLPENIKDIQKGFKKLGCKNVMKIKEINYYMDRRYKYLFYYHEYYDFCILSDEGEKRLDKVLGNLDNQ